MKRTLTMLFAAAAVLAGCAKADEQAIDPSEASESTFFYGSINQISDKTRTTIDGSNGIQWEENDAILAYAAGESDYATENQMMFYADKAGDEAFFSAKNIPAAKTFHDDNDGTGYDVYFGTGEVTISSNKYTVPLIPMSIEGYESGSVRHLPMHSGVPAGEYGPGEREAEFSNNCAVLKVTIPENKLAAANKFVVTAAAADDYIAGAYFMNEGNISLLEGARSNSITYTFTASSDARILYIPVVPGEHQLTFKAYDGESELGSMTMIPAQTTEVNTIYPFDFTGGQYFAISNAAEWNAFAERVTDLTENETKYFTVELTDDITFDSETKFKFLAMYFAGEFNGNKHSIKGATITSGLMRGVRGGYVHDITIAGDCTFSYDLNAYASSGIIARTMTTGTISGCVNNAPIVVKFDTDPGKTRYAGSIVGTITDAGKVSACVNNGAITTSGTTAMTEFVAVGGIVGGVTGTKGAVESCSNSGTISVGGTAKSIYAGGVVGYNMGDVTSCTNNAAASMEATVTRASGDPCKFIYFGGVTGCLNNGKLQNCINEAALTSNSNVKLQYFGGVVGIIEGGSISANVNSGNISFEAAARQIMAGGISGCISAEGTYTFSGTPATGKISITSIESGTASYLYAGGLIGRTEDTKAIVVKGDGLASSCNINVSLSDTTVVVVKGGVGGIVGASLLESKHGSNAISIRNCSVTQGTGISICAEKVTNLGVGGIIGQSLSGVSISDCACSTIKITVTRILKAPIYDFNTDCGGIAGRILGGNSTISKCSNSAEVKNSHYNNNVWSGYTGDNVGGIIGSFGYVSGNTNTITVENCQSSGTCYAYRGCSAGIAGYLSNAAVTGNKFTGTVTRGASAAGIVGVCENSTFSKDTVISKQIKENKAGSCLGHSGGIAGISNSSSFDGCCNNSVIEKNHACYFGALVGLADSGTTVGATTACKVKGTVAGTALTSANYLNYTVGSGLTPTASQVLYWE